MLTHLFVISPCFLGIDKYGVEPIVGFHVAFGCYVQVYSVYIGKQLSVKFGGVTMVSDMFARNSHLSATNTCTNVTHAIVIADFLVQVVGLGFASLSGEEHDAFLRFFVGTNQSSTTTGGYHLVTVEAHDAKLTESTRHTSLIL